MRWVFIRPRNHSPYYDPEIQEPLGLEYLAASRQARGDKTLILDCALDGLSDVRIARRAMAFEPDVIGLSIMTAQEMDSVKHICHEIAACPQSQKPHLIAGGNFISTELPGALSMLPDKITRIPFEGEEALNKISDILNTDCQESARPSTLALPAQLTGPCVSDLNLLAFPVRPYAAKILENGWAFNLQGSRGCCGCCRYCCSPGMAANGQNRWRGRTMSHVVEEIAMLSRTCGAASFNFVDEDFLGPPDLCQARAEEFVNELKKNNLKITFSIQVRPHTLNDPIIGMLAKAGLIFVFLGIESDSQDDYRRWGRPWVADPWQWVAALLRRDVAVNVGVLLFHSHSTYGSIRRFAQKLHEYGLLDHRSATNRLDAMPGSFFHQKQVREGLILKDAVGPQPMPFVFSGMDSLYADVKAALDPLGPPSMHALCALPPLLARRSFDNGAEILLKRVKALIAFQNSAVFQSLIALLDFHEKKIGAPGIVEYLRKKNLEIAVKSAEVLVKNGLAPSVDQLRQAIYMDAGI